MMVEVQEMVILLFMVLSTLCRRDHICLGRRIIDNLNISKSSYLDE
jgi:hypothetical protein